MQMATEPQDVCGAATWVGTRRRKSRHPLAGSCQGINHPYSPLFSFFRSVWLLVVPPVRLTPSAPRFACMWYRFFPAPVPLQDQGLGTCSPRRRPSRPLAHRAPANRRDPTVSMGPPGQGGGLVEPPAKPEVLRRRGGGPSPHHDRLVPVPWALLRGGQLHAGSRQRRWHHTPHVQRPISCAAGGVATQNTGLQAHLSCELTPPALWEHPLRPQGFRALKGHGSAQDVIAGPCPLVRDCLQGDQVMAFTPPTLIDAFDLRVKADGKVGRLHKGPS